MNSDSLGTSATSEHVAPENNTPTNNYRRWMTDMAADIAHLKLYQLAIPGAHNSGVDEDGNYHVGQNWAVCQYNDFSSQLAAGARYLDLRLVDSSYKKDVGGKKPTYQFKEIFEFKHGIVTVGRRLSGLVSAVYNFSTENPGEIVIIDFHHYDKGRHYAHTSLQRCLPYFNSIKNRLIPPSARDLSIGEIRQTHPGCNIILCLSHGSPDNWPGGVVRKDQIWSPLPHQWTSDATETNVTSLVTESMRSPPSGYWVLSAAAGSPPKDLRADHPIRTEAFAPGRQNANILMVDFINGANARTSVVDRCIELSRRIGRDNIRPDAPTNFVVTPKDETVVDGKYENTLVFSWTPSVDNVGAPTYEIHENDSYLARTNQNPYEHKNFILRNYSYKIKGIDRAGNESDWSSKFNLILDATPPTVPDLILAGLELDSAYIQWDPSIDEAGLQGYEVYLDEHFVEFIPPSVTPSVRLDTLIPSTTYVVKVRAKDNNDLYSEYATLKIPTRPTLINPRVTMSSYDEQTQLYDAAIIWDTDIESTAELLCYVETAGIPAFYAFDPGQTISFGFKAKPGEFVKHRCRLKFSRWDVIGATYPYDFIFDTAAPVPISDLKIESRSPTCTSISWAPSTSDNLENYAISVNEEPPILVPSTVNTYTFENMSLDKKFLIEVWALNDVDVPSALESITIEPTPPGKPGAPKATDISYTSATLQWTASADNVAVTGYEVWLNTSLLETVTDTRYTATGLKANTPYTFRIIAKNAAGSSSEPALLTFTTKVDTTPPAQPTGLVAINVSSRAAILTWRNTYDDLRVDHYEILNGDQVIATTETWTPACMLTDLVAGTEYSVRVRALDHSGNRSVVSEPVTVKTPKLGKPQNVRITTVAANKVSVDWDRPNDAVGIIGYHAIVRLPSGSQIKYNLPVSGLIATPLAAATRYQVTISAYDAAQIESDPLTFEIATTGAVARPGTPNFLRLVRLDPDSAYFEWDAPDGPTRPEKYNVTLKGPAGIQNHETANMNVLFNGSYSGDMEYELSVTASNGGGTLLPAIIKF